jgi:hypothetical protein
LTDDLIRFMATRDCLALKQGRDLVEVVLINPVSERYDREKVRRYLGEWRRVRPEAEASITD